MSNPLTRHVWVSYAGAEHQLVADLAAYFDQHKEAEEEDKAKAQTIRLMAYKRDVTSSEPLEKKEPTSGQTQLFLKPGESITDLVDAIASNLRRMLLLSPAYLQRTHCIWELAACFCLPSRSTLFLFKKLASWDEIKQPRNYGFMPGNKQYPLAEVLAYIYRQKVLTRMHQDFHVAGKSEAEQVDFFAQKIELMGDQVFLSVDPSDDKSLRMGIIDYAGSFGCKEIVADFEWFFERHYKKWTTRPYAKQCLKAYVESGDGSGFELQDILQQQRKPLTDFIDQLKDNVLTTTLNANEVKETIKAFAALLALRMVDPEWAAEMRMSSISGVRLRLAVPEKKGPGQRLFDSQLAASVIQQVPTSIEPAKDNPGFNPPTLKGLLTIKPLQGAREQMAKMRKNESRKLLLNLVCLIVGLSNNEAETFLGDEEWEEKLRGRILNRHIDGEQNVLTAARFYIEQNKFQTGSAERWEHLANELVAMINNGAAEDEKIRIATLIVSTRDEGNLIHFVKGKNSIGAFIFELMECCS